MASWALVLSNRSMTLIVLCLGVVVVVGSVGCDDDNVTSHRPSEEFRWPVRISSLEVLKIFNASFVKSAEQPTSHSCPMDRREALLRAG